MMHQPFAQVWTEEDRRWRAIEPGVVKRCRMRGCECSAVAELNRSHTQQQRWWAYCADHLYGRKVDGGKVMFLKNIWPEDST